MDIHTPTTIRIRNILIFISAIMIIAACNNKEDYLNTSAFVSEKTINVIIEISAGTNKKIEYNKAKEDFAIDKIEGVDRIKPYLPYPANYGFVPSTFSDPAVGGDGDPIDVLLIAESLPTGTVIEAIPIAMLRLVDEGEIDDKIICIPADISLRTVDASSIDEINKKYPKALEILELWMTFNDVSENVLVNGYVDSEAAITEIKVCEKAFKKNQ